MASGILNTTGLKDTLARNFTPWFFSKLQWLICTKCEFNLWTHGYSHIRFPSWKQNHRAYLLLDNKNSLSYWLVQNIFREKPQHSPSAFHVLCSCHTPSPPGKTVCLSLDSTTPVKQGAEHAPSQTSHCTEERQADLEQYGLANQGWPIHCCQLLAGRLRKPVEHAKMCAQVPPGCTASALHTLSGDEHLSVCSGISEYVFYQENKPGGILLGHLSMCMQPLSPVLW